MTYDDDVLVNVCFSDHIESQLFWYGFQEADRGLLLCMKRDLPRDGVVIDIGANIGSFSLALAKYLTDGSVYSFEPSPYHYARLLKNVSLNHFDNVVAIPMGAGSQRSMVSLHRPVSTDGSLANSGAASIFHDDTVSDTQVTEQIELVRLDDYFQETALPRLDALKVDVEGAEMLALSGAEGLLRRFRPTIYMEVDKDHLRRAGSSAEQAVAYWHDLDYSVAIVSASGKIQPLTDTSQLRAHQNIRCVPNSLIDS